MTLQKIDELKSPHERIRTFYKILDKDKKERPLVLNGIQQRLSQCKHNRQRILKARQVGISTYYLIKMLDYTLFHNNVTSVIIAHEQDAIEKLFRIVRFAYDKMDPEDRPRLDRGGGSKYEMFYPEINSRIYVDLHSRGDTISWLHISEAAFVRDWDNIIATKEAVPVGRGVIVEESTPNGLNHFYDNYRTDEQYQNLFFPWFFMEEYKIDGRHITKKTDEEIEFIKKSKRMYGVDITDAQLAFRRYKQEETKHLFKQEYPEDDITCFMASGNAAFDLEKIQQRLNTITGPIKDEGVLKIYEEPQKDTLYVIGADCAEGTGGDRSAASVFNARTLKQAAVMCGDWKPYDFAHRLNILGLRYHRGASQMPLLAVERNNHGHAVIQELHENIHYENLFVDKDDKIGFHTNSISRPVMMDMFIEGVESGQVELNDHGTLQECLTLINNDGKIEAEQGKNDDRIIASAIAVRLCIQSRPSKIYDNIGNWIRT